MTTLRRLVNSPRLGLNVLAGADGLDRPLSWVAVSELDDPTPYLEGAELLLTTGVGRQFGAGSAEAYVHRLVAAGVSGLGFGVGVSHELVPEQLVAAAEQAGLPLIEVDRPTPFIAVSKELADLFAGERLDRARRELAGMQALTAALLGPGGAQDVVARLARLVEGWVVVLDQRGTAVHTGGAVEEEHLALAHHLAGALRGRGRHASAVDAHPTGRVTALPVGLDERVAGALVVGATAGVEPGAPGLLAFVASLLTLDRERGPASTELAAWGRAASVAVQLGLPVPPPAGAAAFPTGTRLRAVVVHATVDDVVTRFRGRRDDDAVVVLPVAGLPGEGALVVVGEPLEEALSALAGLAGGVSEPVPPARLGEALNAARILARRSRRSLAVGGQAVPSVQELLGETLPAFAETLLAPVRAAPGGDVLMQTLRTWLSLHGQTVAAAAAIGVHRHTVRERLRRSAALLGRDLDDPQVRAELWLALTP